MSPPHDRMPRLFNRNQYIRDLSLGEDLRPAGVLSFDLNNLKLINDRNLYHSKRCCNCGK